MQRYWWGCSLWLLTLWEELKTQGPVSIACDVAPHSGLLYYLQGAPGTQIHTHSPVPAPHPCLLWAELGSDTLYLNLIGETRIHLNP